MSTTPTTASTSTERTARGLRTLYFVRTAFSVVWVVLVFLLAASVSAGSPPSVAAWVLLAVYPLWDAAATLLDIRASAAPSKAAQYVNVAAGLLATVGILVALASGLAPAIVVFGVWAFVSGAVQLFLALRRRRALGAQWGMIVSGSLSVIAGVSFAIMAGSPSFALGTLAGYSAFGAFWYLVTAIWLTRSVRAARTATAG